MGRGRKAFTSGKMGARPGEYTSPPASAVARASRPDISYSAADGASHVRRVVATGSPDTIAHKKRARSSDGESPSIRDTTAFGGSAVYEAAMAPGLRRASFAKQEEAIIATNSRRTVRKRPIAPAGSAGTSVVSARRLIWY